MKRPLLCSWEREWMASMLEPNYSPRNLLIFRRWLDGGSLVAIGKEFDISRTRVSQITAGAMSKIARRMKYWIRNRK